MADKVHYVMDRLAAVFALMRDTQLFTEAEVKSVVQKITNFEYTLQRRQLEVKDLLEYVNYAVQLHELRGAPWL